MIKNGSGDSEKILDKRLAFDNREAANVLFGALDWPDAAHSRQALYAVSDL